MERPTSDILKDEIVRLHKEVREVSDERNAAYKEIARLTHELAEVQRMRNAELYRQPENGEDEHG